MEEKKAVIYLRQSSGDEKESDSIESQREKCREYAQKNGYDIVAEYDDGNISGRTYPVGAEVFAEKDIKFIEYFNEKIKRHNKKYRKGLADVIGHFEDVKNLIVHDLDRILRPYTNSFLGIYLAQIFIDKKVKLITLDAGLINFNDYMSNFVSNIRYLVNDNALELCHKRSVKALKDLKADGALTNCVKCLGYESCGKQKVKKNEDALIVEQIFEKFNSGESIGSIVKYLNNNDPKNRKWIHTYVLRVLRRLTYTGQRYDDNGDLIDIKPLKGIEIVHKKDFLLAKERLERNTGFGRSNQSRKVHPLSGILHCGSCTGIMETRGTTEGKTYYNCKYNSTLKQGGKTSCTTSFLMETCITGEIKCHDFIAYPIKESLKPLIFKSWIMKKYESKMNEDYLIKKDQLQKRLEMRENKENDLMKKHLIDEPSDEPSDEPLSESQFVKAMKLFELEKKSISREIKELNEKIDSSIGTHKFEEYFDTMEALFFTGKGKYRRFNKEGKELEHKDIDDKDYSILARKTFKRIYIYKYHIYIIFKDLSHLLLERICYCTGRHFPKISISLDTKSKPYGYKFYVWQKTMLKDIFTINMLPVEDYKPQKIIYDENNMKVITLGENDTDERYKKEGLTYLDNLPKE